MLPCCMSRRVFEAEELSSALAEDLAAAESRADGQVACLQALVFPCLQLHKELAAIRKEAERVCSDCEAELEERVRLLFGAV
jgi:hypothetical protein